MGFGIIIIGDEILSGRREDKHLAKAIELLGARGLQLAWARYLGDDRERLVSLLRESFASGDVVFSCGGIGATPDDHTRQAAAAALGLRLRLHPEAAQLITLRTAEMAAEGRAKADMSLPENQQRLKMGEFPEGADIIPNPYNRIPGFEIRNHFFLPGFPVMAWPMMAWVLDQRFGHLHHQTASSERSFLVYELAESTATPLMESLEREFVGIKVFSLPSMGDDGSRRHIELGVKGPTSQVDAAFEKLRAGAAKLGGEVGVEQPARGSIRA